MVLSSSRYWPRRDHWDAYSLSGINVQVQVEPLGSGSNSGSGSGSGSGRSRSSSSSSSSDDDDVTSPRNVPPYFWNKGVQHRLRRLMGRKPRQHAFPIHRGYSEARSLIGQGTVLDVENLSFQALDFVAQVFEDIEEEAEEEKRQEEEERQRAAARGEGGGGGGGGGGAAAAAAAAGNGEKGQGISSSSSSSDECSASDETESLPSSPESGPLFVHLRLSPELERWKEAQHAAGRVLPPKGPGLSRTSDEILHLLGASDWPEAMQTNNALFGCGIASLLMGAADPQTMFSNYVTDMAFYYEHGYNHVFPSLEPLLERGLRDRHALRTPGGRERRAGVCVGKRYIQGKIALEKAHKAHLTNRSARLSRRTAQIVSLSESSLLGMATEAIARGYDAGAVMSDLVFSSPGTDVVDVGCDLINSEVMNSFLNVADVTDTGLVTEPVLRAVYDAYAATGARMLTQRWHEPLARMCAALYTWHIQNDRHMFLRRALLGWPKARKFPARPQFEADFDEVFDKDYRTTGFSRPLDPRYECNGQDTCDHVTDFFHRHHQDSLLRDLWWHLVLGPLQYVRRGRVDQRREHMLAEGSRLRMAQLFSKGLVLEMVWLIAHANHHAWQVNHLFEAAMFGSILDGGKLAGKLDRHDDEKQQA